MFSRLGISVGNLLLDLENYRIVKQTSQKGARDAIITEQGRKLVKLAEDIVAIGLNPFDLPMVIDANDGNENYIVIEGNRRLTAIQLMMQPELARDTTLFSAFNRLHNKHGDAIPKVLECVVAPSKAAALVWINRKHANGLNGAGTEHWTAMAKARADVAQGIPRPDLDIIEFVLTDPSLDSEIRSELEGASFNLTTLQRLATTRELQQATDLSLAAGKLSSGANKEWVRDVFTDVVKTIATGKHGDEKFTERLIDSPEKRGIFIAQILAKHPAKKEATKPWKIDGGKPVAATKTARPPAIRTTPSTEDQVNLVPKKFRLELPAGKINDIFTELKKLDVTTYRHADSVLFRVFIELSVDTYLRSQKASLHASKKDTLFNKLKLALDRLESNGTMTDKELASIKTELSDKNSLISPVTLNAYVHSEWMNPEPLRLKISWSNIQLTMERMWGAIRQAGQP